MTIETLAKGEELQAQIEYLNPQIRKLSEAIAFMESNGEKYHYHLWVLPFGLQKPDNHIASWHFLPEYFVDMFRTQLDKLKADQAAAQAEFDAL